MSFSLSSMLAPAVARSLQTIAAQTAARRAIVNAAHAEALKHAHFYQVTATRPETLLPVPSDPLAPAYWGPDEPRKVTSGGPRDRARHIAYQKAYQTARKAKGFGVKFPSGRVVRYATRSQADKARYIVSAVVASQAVR